MSVSINAILNSAGYSGDSQGLSVGAVSVLTAGFSGQSPSGGPAGSNGVSPGVEQWSNSGSSWDAKSSVESVLAMSYSHLSARSGISSALISQGSQDGAGLDPLSPKAVTAAGAAALTQVITAAASALFQIKSNTATGLANLIGSAGFGLLLQISGGGGTAPAAAGPMGVMQAELLAELEQLAKMEKQVGNGSTPQSASLPGLHGANGIAANA